MKNFIINNPLSFIAIILACLMVAFVTFTEKKIWTPSERQEIIQELDDIKKQKIIEAEQLIEENRLQLIKTEEDIKEKKLELENLEAEKIKMKNLNITTLECLNKNETTLWQVTRAVDCKTQTRLTIKDATDIKQAKAIEPPKTENKKSWDRFNWSYEIDGWLVNSDWKSQARFTLEWDNPNNRSINLLNRYWFDADDANLWLEAEDRWWIMRWVMICISKADSALWKALKTENNFWNVGNNDRWDRVHFSSKEEWINAIWRVLHNKYLSHKQSIWSLSAWWGGSAPYYATSKQNWNNNVLNCLKVIYQDTRIDENFIFRK